MTSLEDHHFDLNDEEGIYRAYENVRAAHRGFLHPPQLPETSGIDWKLIQAFALKRKAQPFADLEKLVDRLPSGALAGSMAIPMLIIAALLIFVGTLRFSSFAVAALVFLGLFLIVGVCGLWIFVAFEAATSASVTEESPMLRRLATASVYVVVIGTSLVAAFVMVRKPEPRQTAFANGLVALSERRYTVALERFANASLTAAEDARFLITLGDTLSRNCLTLNSDRPTERAQQLKLAEAAQRYYQQAEKLEPGNAYLRVQIATLYSVRGDNKAAEQIARQVAEDRTASPFDRVKAADLQAAVLEIQAAELQKQASLEAATALQETVVAAVQNAATLDQQSQSAESSEALSRLLMTQAIIAPASEKETLTARAVEAKQTALARGGRSVGPIF